MQRNGKIFVFSELDRIAAISEPDITLKNSCIQARKQEGWAGQWGGIIAKP